MHRQKWNYKQLVSLHNVTRFLDKHCNLNVLTVAFNLLLRLLLQIRLKVDQQLYP
jgi:hypothetical protein